MRRRSEDGDARSQQRRAGTGQSNQTTSTSNAVDSATVADKYTTGQATYATSRMLEDHLTWLVEECEAAGRPVRAIIPLLARAKILSRDIAVTLGDDERGAA